MPASSDVLEIANWPAFTAPLKQIIAATNIGTGAQQSSGNFCKSTRLHVRRTGFVWRSICPVPSLRRSLHLLQGKEGHTKGSGATFHSLFTTISVSVPSAV